LKKSNTGRSVELIHTIFEIFSVIYIALYIIWWLVVACLMLGAGRSLWVLTGKPTGCIGDEKGVKQHHKSLAA
jgi:hypothetical protein